jgi:hypothetical protein
VFTESAALSGTPGTNLTATPSAGLHGAVATTTVTADSTPNGFTGHTSYTTPGGVVTVTFGGSNNYNSNSTRLGQTGVVNADYTIASSTDPAVTTAGGGSFENYAPVVGLQYSSFGVWSLNPCNNNSNCTPAYAGTYGGAQPGQALTATMPTTGTAAYTGGATGYVIQPVATNSTNAAQFYGTSSLTANFATGNVTGSITAINAYSVNNGGSGQTLLGTINNIGVSGTISGSTFGGTASVTGSAGSAFDIAGATGTMKGGFYGPAANEVAGVFNLSGGANNTTLMGSFGAKQAPSDRRLKVDVEPLGALPNGLKLYGWRYSGGAHRFTGVMAQDLLADARYADAVIVDDSGLMRVDYARIGYVPPDFAMMRQEGEAALARYRQSRH